jgi:hypothetical protein
MTYRAATVQKIRTVVDNFHVKRFLNTRKELSIVTDNSLAIHGDRERSRAILAANAIVRCICHFKGVRISGNGTRLDDGAEWAVVAAEELSSDQRSSTVAERPACFQGKVIMHDLHNNLDS